MHKPGLCRRAVAGWMGGCLSVTFVYRVETANDKAVVAIACEQETVPRLSNGRPTTFNDLVRPLTQISSLRHYYAPAPVGEAGALGGHRHPSSVRLSV